MILKTSTLEQATLPSLVRLAKYVRVDFSINTNAMHDKLTLIRLISEKIDVVDVRWPKPLYARNG